MIKKNFILVFCFIAVIALGLTGLVMAKEKQVVNVNPSKGHAVVAIPAQAVQVAPGIFSLGTTVDNGKLVQGYMIFKYDENFAKPGTICGNGVCEPGENINKCPADCGGSEDPTEPDTSSCYVFLSREAKWKVIEPYLVDATNNHGLTSEFISANLAADINKWEIAGVADILGNEVAGVVDGPDMVTTDNKNEVMFGSIQEPGAIAVTIIWGIFKGPPVARELVEWDMVFDEVDYGWSATGTADKMDFENIATHELGHSVGLGDLYTTECQDMTMYGYADFAEINKRDLEDGDVAGISKLYE